MPSKIFKRKGTSRDSPSSSSHGHGGITIAAAGASSPKSVNAGNTHLDYSTTLSLLPESNYRTSLIMPHLKRRFTLLRAPDGTMVTPDAMRAHLRAQRARARAAGTPGAQNFLTEEEENEIIDQLRSQAYLDTQEGGTDDHYDNDGTFGGTDGFGSWGSPPSSPLNRVNPLNGAESPLQRSISSHDASLVGSLFSGRSSARDQAYISGVQRSRAASRSRDDAESSNSHKIGKTDLYQVNEVTDTDEKTEMPGDFLLATKRASQRASSDAALRPSKSSSKSSKGSSLLTTLSPEAYKRVSTALEEVYDMISGKSSSSSGNGVNGSSLRGYESSEIVDERSLAPSRGRPSVESDARSFTSARSDMVNGSVLPADGTAAIGASMMMTADSSSTLKAMIPPQDWSTTEARSAQKGAFVPPLQQTSSISHTAAAPPPVNNHDGALGRPPISPRSKQRQISLDTANGRMKRGPSSPSANTFQAVDSRSPKVSTIPLEPSYNDTSNAQGLGPLQSGFDQAGLRSNKSSSSSAAATAAGIAAAAFVAEHQDKAKQKGLEQQEASQSYHSQPVTHQIVQGGRGATSYESNIDTANRPQVLRSPSAATSSVLSADAIAARSHRYFPPASAQSAQKYADAFRAPSTPNTTTNTPNSSSDNAYHHRRQQSDAKVPGQLLQQRAAYSPVASNGNITDPLSNQSSYSYRRDQQPRLNAGANASSIVHNANQTNGTNDFEVEDDDVWARIAANNSANDTSPLASYRSKVSEDRPIPSQSREPEISLDRLHEIQKSLVRSASAKGKDPNQQVYNQRSNSTTPAPPLPVSPYSTLNKTTIKHSHKASNSFGSDSADSVLGSAKLEKARERARLVASQQSQTQHQDQPQSPASPSFDAAPYTSILSAIQFPDQQPMHYRDSQSHASNSSQVGSRVPSSERSSTAIHTSTPSPNGGVYSFSKPARSQVMYDVTTSHRPMSPPLRGHKTSLSNLPSLQDLSMNANALSFALEPKHESIDSMLESSTRAHDALSKDSSIVPSPLSRSNETIPEEAAEVRASMMTFEEVKVEDGFGGFMTEKRPMIRSQSHDVLSSMTKSEDKSQSPSQSQGPASPMTPASTYSEPLQMGQQQRNDSNPWARINGNKENLLYDNMLDDVAAQTKAATLALKGDHPVRPQMRSRSKSFSRGSKKNWSKNISQPQLVSTSQKLEHAEEVPRIDRTLTRKDFKRHLESAAPQQTKEQQQQQQPQTPILPSTMRSRTNSVSGHSATKSVNTPMRPDLTSKRTTSSTTSSPTDYRTEAKMQMRSTAPLADGPMRRSNSFGHRKNPSTAFSNRAATPPASATTPQQSQNINSADISPQSERSERSATGLSRFMSKLRSRRPSDISLLAANSTAMKSSPQLPNFGTPSTSASVRSPEFVTPREDFSPSRQVDDNKVPPLPSGNVPTSLASLFGPKEIPSRSSSVRVKSPKGSPPLPLPATNGINGRMLGSPALIQEAFAGNSNNQSSSKTSADGGLENSTPIAPVVASTEEKPITKRSARDTIVRRTLIVSTTDNSEERRKSTAPVRKLSLRKPVPNVNDIDEQPKDSSSRRSSMARKSMQDQPSTPPEHDTRRKTSQDTTPPEGMRTAPRTVFESSSLAPPSPRQGGSNRVSNATSEYGTSLYDMYIDQDGSEAAHQRNSRQAAPIPSSRQSLAADGGNSARHIEVTERADGSIVWQVIAGLADRSSTYSMSMLNGFHSRVASGDSTYSANNLGDDDYSPQLGKGYSALGVHEDGRSLFARTKGQHRKSFSYDASNDPIPPLPPISSNLQGNTAAASNVTPPLGFDIANPSGGAATRIVYTSDAELASMLEALAGPEKTSAKFEFQRVRHEDGGIRPVSVWTDNSQLRSDQRSSKDVGGGGGGGSSINSSLVDSKERNRIEAEIYSLLQRDGHSQNIAAVVAKQHTEGVNGVHSKDGNARASVTSKISAQVV